MYCDICFCGATMPHCCLDDRISSEDLHRVMRLMRSIGVDLQQKEARASDIEKLAGSFDAGSFN